MIVNMICDVVELDGGIKMTTEPTMIIVIKKSDPDYEAINKIVTEYIKRKES